ncbi:MAG: hypothetical protein ACRET9_03770, partial [Burkholderiales bacterium]
MPALLANPQVSCAYVANERDDMDKSDKLHNILLGLAALVLVGVLAFLYDKTQAVDLREQNEILGFLRELKEIDGRWDVDVLRARLEFGANDLP